MDIPEPKRRDSGSDKNIARRHYGTRRIKEITKHARFHRLRRFGTPDNLLDRGISRISHSLQSDAAAAAADVSAAAAAAADAVYFCFSGELVARTAGTGRSARPASAISIPPSRQVPAVQPARKPISPRDRRPAKLRRRGRCCMLLGCPPLSPPPTCYLDVHTELSPDSCYVYVDRSLAVLVVYERQVNVHALSLAALVTNETFNFAASDKSKRCINENNLFELRIELKVLQRRPK